MKIVTARRVLEAVAATLAAAAFVFGGVATVPVALGEPNSDSWDIGEFDYCIKQTSKALEGVDPLEVGAKVEENQKYCCYRSGGVWNGSTCVAPSGNSPGAQQVPGDIQTAPVIDPGPAQAEPPPPGGGVPVIAPPLRCPPDGRVNGCLPQKVR